MVVYGEFMLTDKAEETIQKNVKKIGRPKVDVDYYALMSAADAGLSRQDMTEEFGISAKTLQTRVGELRKLQGVVTKYRAVQAIELTCLQARVLAQITEDKIEAAPLRDLVAAFKILKDRELVMDGKPSEIQGLIGYLVQMEKEDLDERVDARSKAIDVTPTEVEEKLPDL